MAKDPSYLRALNNGKFYFVDNEMLHFTFKPHQLRLTWCALSLEKI